MGLLPGSSRGNKEKAAPVAGSRVDNGAGRAMVVAMPRDGATIFGDLIGKLDSPYKSGPSKAWLKIKNPKAPAATRVVDGTF